MTLTACIYKVFTPISNQIYVGSLRNKNQLNQKLAYHKCRAYNGRKSKFYTYMWNLGPENFFIEIIVEFPYTNDDDLHRSEDDFIVLNGTLNTKRAINTSNYHRQYSKENRIKENQKQRIRVKIKYDKIKFLHHLPFHHE